MEDVMTDKEEIEHYRKQSSYWHSKFLEVGREKTTTKVLKKRTVGGHKYIDCPECKTEIHIQKPITVDLPYCGSCGKSVEDAEHGFCGWCGTKFES